MTFRTKRNPEERIIVAQTNAAIPDTTLAGQWIDGVFVYKDGKLIY